MWNVRVAVAYTKGESFLALGNVVRRAREMFIRARKSRPRSAQFFVQYSTEDDFPASFLLRRISGERATVLALVPTKKEAAMVTRCTKNKDHSKRRWQTSCETIYAVQCSA